MLLEDPHCLWLQITSSTHLVAGWATHSFHGVSKKEIKKVGPQVQDPLYRRESVTGYPIVLLIMEYVKDAQAVLRRVVTSNTGRPVTSLTMSA